jgi:2,4-dienoyl-CoA reductase-like NADH-dependent reductase (Old Yellow Enzyme family)
MSAATTPATNPAPLFQPFALKSLKLANRIVMAPMTRSFSPGGVPGANVAAYYRRRAEHDVGLIITEGTLIAHPAAGNDPDVPRFHGDDALAGWANVVKEVHAVGGHIMPQLWHVGSVRRAGQSPNPEAPPISASGMFKPGKQISEPATEPQIADLIAAFAQGAADAHRLGFDGIEIHGAHGYLIDQFFWDGTNVRTDRYGGDLASRAHFAVEIVKACRRATAPDFPIVLRFSQWKQQQYDARLATSPEQLATFLAPLADAGVDLFHCSNRRFWEPEFSGSAMNLAGWTKKLSGKPVITVGSIGLDTDFLETFAGKSAHSETSHMARLLEMVSSNEVDLVAVGRMLIADPAWASKQKSGRTADVIPYTRECLTTLV